MYMYSFLQTVKSRTMLPSEECVQILKMGTQQKSLDVEVQPISVARIETLKHELYLDFCSKITSQFVNQPNIHQDARTFNLKDNNRKW